MEKALREEILAPYFYGEETGGIHYFRNLPIGVLKNLINNRFVELEAWNSCPGVSDLFLPFLETYPEFTAHEYAVDWNRPDHRITIEGVSASRPLNREELIDFVTTFREADDLDVGLRRARCWYD